MSIKEIIAMPRVLQNIHESSFRSYHILEHILEMVNRGDSKKTILDMATFLHHHNKPEMITFPEPLNPEEKEALKEEWEQYKCARK